MAIALLGVLWPLMLLAMALFALRSLLFTVTQTFAVFVSIKKSLPDERYGDWQTGRPTTISHSQQTISFLLGHR